MDRALLFVFIVALLTGTSFASEVLADAERKVEGRVLHVKVTLCQFKPRGCAGYMILGTGRDGRREQLTVQVRLGVPIRHGEDYILLANLLGRTVSVTHVVEKGALVARLIEVLEKP